MTDASRPTPALRDDLQGVQPYGAPQVDVPVRLNTNENPFPPSESLAGDIGRAVARTARTLNRYPDREATEVRRDLARYLARESGVDVDPDCIWVANGSNEVMQHIFGAFGGPGRRALSFAPTYSMYAQYARDSHTEYVTDPRAEDFSLDAARIRASLRDRDPDLVVLTSPNNPTGTALDAAAVIAAAESARGIVVVDEAYAEFRRPGTPSALELLSAHPRLIVTRTMSKAFALAGARVGYAVGDPSLLAGLRLVRLPYHLSSVTQAVAQVALAHADELLAQVDLLRRERDALVAWLRAAGMAAVDSDANFILFGRFADPHALWQALLAHGVLVRESGPEGWLRVSVGTPEENAAFRDALERARSASGMISSDGGAWGSATAEV